MRRNVDEDEDGIWDYNIDNDFVIEPCKLNGSVFWDMNLNEEYNEGIDTNISGANITISNNDLDIEFSTFSEENGTYLFDDLPPGKYEISFEVQGHTIGVGTTGDFVRPGQEISMDFGIKPTKLYGNLSSLSGEVIVGQEITLLDNTNETTITLQSGAEGYYSFDLLLQGNFTLSIDVDGFEAFEEEMILDHPQG